MTVHRLRFRPSHLMIMVHWMRRLVTALLLAAPLTFPGAAHAQQGGARIARPAAAAPHTTYVLVHGAWGGGWDWQAVDSALTARGHRVHRVTLTGLGERMHLATPEVGLATHVLDVVNTLRFERLTDVVLVGHSYGGMVITGAADQVPERIRRLVYIDAFLPDSGESVASITGPVGAVMASRVKHGMLDLRAPGDTLRIPGDVPHPYRTFTDTLHLMNPKRAALPATYVLTIDPGQTDDPVFSPHAARAKAKGYTLITMTADHTPERSAVPELTTHLHGAAAR